MDLKCTCFGSTYTKIGTIQRRLAWPLRKDDTQNREAFHIFRSAQRVRAILHFNFKSFALISSTYRLKCVRYLYAGGGQAGVDGSNRRRKRFRPGSDYSSSAIYGVLFLALQVNPEAAQRPPDITSPSRPPMFAATAAASSRYGTS